MHDCMKIEFTMDCGNDAETPVTFIYEVWQEREDTPTRDLQWFVEMDSHDSPTELMAFEEVAADVMALEIAQGRMNE